MKGRLLATSFLAVFLSNSAFAVEFGKPIEATIPNNDTAMHLLLNGESPSQKISLMNIKLTDHQKKILQTFSSSPRLSMTRTESNIPAAAFVDVRNLPVLNQGQQSTCVTFAVTAAFDSLLNKGDYVSQLCSLMLGQYLEPRGYYTSGWDGSMGPWVINQFLQYGLVNKDKQHAKLCAGIKKYPEDESYKEYNFSDILEYKKISEDITTRFYFQTITSFTERFKTDGVTLKNYDADSILQKVKVIIANYPNTRLTFGVLLPMKHCNEVGLCGTTVKANDTWVLTNGIRKDTNVTYGGHEMMIVGYDDNAVSTDNEGYKHRGLLTLRNSWGEKAGDNGNFYMSYDFFKQYMDEVQAITKAN